MKKVVIAAAVVFSILCLAAIGFGAKAFMEGYQKARAVPVDLATRAWQDQVKLGDVVTIDVPYPLHEQKIPMDDETKALISETVHYSYERGVFVILAGFVSYKEEVALNLPAAAEASVTDLGTRPGFKMGGSRMSDTTILGSKAVEALAEGTVKGTPIEFRGLYFTGQGRFFQLVFLAPKDSEAATAAWRRMKESIRETKPAAEAVKPSGLPAGMKPRKIVKPE